MTARSLPKNCVSSAGPRSVEPIGSRQRSYLAGFANDVKLALRNIRTKPAFSLMVIGMLALGVAGNVAIFSIFNGLFLRPLPFAEAERLIDLDETAPKWNLHYTGISDLGLVRLAGRQLHLRQHGFL